MTPPTSPTQEGAHELSADLYLILNQASVPGEEITNSELEEIDRIRQMIVETTEDFPVFMTCS